MRLALCLLIASLLAGCVFFRTQAYDFAVERWRACESRSPGARLERITPDGLIRFHHSDPAASAALKSCLDETADRQALRVLAPKPPSAITVPK